MIIDRIFSQIKNVKGTKKIYLKTDFYQNEEELFNAIFWGSNFFGIEVHKFIKSDKIREIISPVLKQLNISFIIQVYDQKQNLVKEYEL
jgi:hypothetical protein